MPQPSSKERSALDGLLKQLERSNKGPLSELPDTVREAFETLDSRAKGQVSSRDFPRVLKTLRVRVLSRDEKTITDYLDGCRGAEPGLISAFAVWGIH